MTLASSFNLTNRTRIKICGITNKEDLYVAVQAGVDALGFVLYEGSARAVSFESAVNLASLLPPFVTPVFLFVNSNIKFISKLCLAIPNALVQFHGDETPEQCTKLRCSFIRAARIPLTLKDCRDYDRVNFNLLNFIDRFSSAKAILLDAYVPSYGGGGKAFDWSKLPKNIDANLILSGGLNANNVEQGIMHMRSDVLAPLRTLAVDVSSGVESKPGIKDAKKIYDFVAKVRQADGLC